jgi:hypothetical protein
MHPAFGVRFLRTWPASDAEFASIGQRIVTMSREQLFCSHTLPWVQEIRDASPVSLFTNLAPAAFVSTNNLNADCRFSAKNLRHMAPILGLGGRGKLHVEIMTVDNIGLCVCV